MLPDRVSNESGALPIALRGPADILCATDQINMNLCTFLFVSQYITFIK